MQKDARFIILRYLLYVSLCEFGELCNAIMYSKYFYLGHSECLLDIVNESMNVVSIYGNKLNNYKLYGNTNKVYWFW